MPDPLFHAPRLKIKRAHRHIAELEQAEARLIEDPAFSITTAPCPDSTGHWRCIVDTCKPVPCEVPLILGDAIHNLRAALDLLACDLVRANNGDPSRVYFPFCRDGNDLDDMIRRRNLNRCSPDVVDLIRSIKPYKGGNDALRAIHDLDIADKHKLLIPALLGVLQPSLELDFVNRLLIQRGRTGCEAIIEPGTVLQDRIPNGVPLDVFSKKKYVTCLIFDADQPLAGEPVTPTLKKLAKLADGIVQTFATHLLRKQINP